MAWILIGRAALEDRVDPGWMAAWVLILLTLVPLRSGVTWLQGVVSTRAGSALKQRLLAGALRLEPEEIRHRGTGELLGKVLESEALESLALGGGFSLLQGGIEVVIAAVVLASGAGGWLHVGLLALWLAITAGLGLDVLPAPRAVDRCAPRDDPPVGREPARLSDAAGAGGPRALARS